MPITNSQYNILMNMYEQRRLRSRDRLNLHYEKVYAALPGLKEIDSAISDRSVEQAKRLLDGDDSALKELKQELGVLTRKKAALLAEGGFPPDYLEPSYECKDCQDTGYTGNRKCHCFLKAVIDLFYTQSNLAGVLEEENFDHFSFLYYSENYIDRMTGESASALAHRAYDECRQFIRDFDSVHGNLLLFGTTGTGKTYLTHCIARELMQTVHSVLYLTSAELFDALLDKALGKSEDSLVLCEQIETCDLLIIDDLGTERNTDFVISQLFVCLNERILNKKSTVISTNLTLEEIKTSYTERTFSRISNHFRILRMAGDDIRIQKKLMKREAN